MEISIKKDKVVLELSVDEATILASSIAIVANNTEIPVFVQMANQLAFNLSAADKLISNMSAYKDGN